MDEAGPRRVCLFRSVRTSHSLICYHVPFMMVKKKLTPVPIRGSSIIMPHVGTPPPSQHYTA